MRRPPVKQRAESGDSLETRAQQRVRHSNPLIGAPSLGFLRVSVHLYRRSRPDASPHRTEGEGAEQRQQEEFDRIYRSYFSSQDALPARTRMQAGRTPMDCGLEVEAIGYVP